MLQPESEVSTTAEDYSSEVRVSFLSEFKDHFTNFSKGHWAGNTFAFCLSHCIIKAKRFSLFVLKKGNK